ncbi:ACP S-malonyltransferase (plasmid) [Streptomyces yangpuensis]|uniref:[acyl-carrier-protein] S-malonyltransferase n=1 Tax=Streptomyces yangpuensis TaxID=1648182 RepID=A0ABY5Q8D3_9ACTN|nr:ACP S-malonyltransferase [Streptomyces yangpuensis]UUY52504.1 ACP S-malonyltransferase [Streptomyces yangpuensis]
METENRTGSALVFPGMGPAPFTEVARFMLVNSFARELQAEADDVLGYSLFDRFSSAEGDYSEHAQLAFFLNCLALARWSEAELGARPDYVTGPSFGGKATAVHSGALSVADGIRLTARFARVLDSFFGEEYPEQVATQSFARTPRAVLEEILAELTEQGEWHEITCVVDDDFHMLTLRTSRLEWLQQRLRAAGGLPLYVMEPPMHAPAFDGLRRKAEAEVMAGLEFRDPHIPVVSDHDGTVLTSGEQVRNLLLDGCVRRVNWPGTLAALRGHGVGTLHVAGQDALFGRVAVAAKNFTVVPANPRLATRPRRRPVPAAA